MDILSIILVICFILLLFIIFYKQIINIFISLISYIISIFIMIYLFILRKINKEKFINKITNIINKDNKNNREHIKEIKKHVNFSFNDNEEILKYKNKIKRNNSLLKKYKV